MKTSQISNKEIKLEMKNTDNSIKYSLEVTKILVVTLVCVFIFQPLNMFRKKYTLL